MPAREQLGTRGWNSDGQGSTSRASLPPRLSALISSTVYGAPFSSRALDSGRRRTPGLARVVPPLQRGAAMLPAIRDTARSSVQAT
jgi:hypothetical protein